MNIKSRLVILFLVISIAPVAVFGAATTISTEQEITTNALRELDALATIQESRVQDVLDQNLEQLVTFTSRLQLKISIDGYNKNGDAESQELANRIIESAQAATPSFREIHVLNMDGVVVASADSAAIGRSYAEEEFFAKAKEQNDPYNIAKDGAGNLVFNLSGPMVLDGSPIGVAVIVSDAGSLISAVQDSHAFGQTSETVLVRQHGDGAQFIVPLRFDPDAALSRISTTDSELPSYRALAGIEGTFTDLVNYRGEPVIGATRYIDEPGWGLIVKINRAEAYAPLDNVRNLSIVVGAVVAAAAVATSFVLGRSIATPILKLRNAADEITKGNYDIDIVVDSKDEVGQLAQDFCNMKNSVKSTNENLERLVKQRTSELTKTNKELVEKESELETFSYSISHELRAPLRAIDGFSNIIIEDYGDKLDAAGRQKLETIRANAQRMGRLIEDLLSFSRSGRQKITRENVDMGGVVKTILDGFKEATAGRDVKYTIKELPVCSCDPSLILQVWTNLISNAIKFTKNRHPAAIEIGGKSDGDTVVYYVKDNGAGFSMDYANKLFKVFNRLHDQNEFEGTGVGLAIVEQIVRRHGGIAWAEGEAGKGAKFSFMLPMILTKKISA